MAIINSSVESSSIYNKEYINKHASMNHVVANAKTYWHLERSQDTESTKITYIIQVDLGGFIPHLFVEKGAVEF